jgi:hypothetical protein
MKTFSLLLAVAFVGVCAGAEQKPASTPQAKEPIFEGKTLGVWIALTKDKDEKVRASAAEAIGKIGPEAKIVIPALIDLLSGNAEIDIMEKLWPDGRSGKAWKGTA